MVLQCNDPMLCQMRGDECVACLEYALHAIDGGLERTRDHIGDLIMHIVGMGSANGTLVKLNQNRHELRCMRNDFAANAFAQFGPLRRVAVKKVHSDTVQK